MNSFSVLLVKLQGLALAVWRQWARLRVAQTAGSLAFLSLLALVPIVSIALSVLTALPVFSRLRTALQSFLAANLFLPSFSDTLMRYVNQFAAKANELSVVGAALFFATALAALFTIDRTLNQIWGSTRRRPLSRRITLYWTMLTLGPLLLAAGVTINGLIVQDLLSELPSREVQLAWLWTVPWVTTIAGLTLLYRLVPEAHVRWREAVGGALVAGIALDILKRTLGGYVAKLPTYTVVYGTFAALPLFLVWLYAFWMAILIGALIAANLRFWGSGTDVHLSWRPAERFEAGARVLIDLAARQAEGHALVPAAALRPVFGGDAVRAEDTAQLLASLDYVSRVWRLHDVGVDGPSAWIWHEQWALRRPAHESSLRRLFEAVWTAEHGGDTPVAALLRRRSGLAAVPLLPIDAPTLDLGIDVLVHAPTARAQTGRL